MRTRYIRILSFISTFMVLMAIWGSGSSTASAKRVGVTPADTSNCQSVYGHDWYNHAVDLSYLLGTNCFEQAQLADAYVANCNTIPVNDNVDVWQTQNINGSGTDYTGWTGDVSYPQNCSFYYIQRESLRSPQVEPNWGCGDEYIYDTWGYSNLCWYFP